jgi:hypothetical protein
MEAPMSRVIEKKIELFQSQFQVHSLHMSHKCEASIMFGAFDLAVLEVLMFLHVSSRLSSHFHWSVN